MITPEMLYAQYSNFQTISVEDNYLIGRIVAEVNWVNWIYTIQLIISHPRLSPDGSHIVFQIPQTWD